MGYTNDLSLNNETHVEVVYKNHGGTYKESHRIKGADHGEVPATWGFKDYAEAIAMFVLR